MRAETWTAWLLRSLATRASVAGVEQLRGGSKKGVYRVRLDDDRSVVLYSWDATENYWPADGLDAGTEPFADASGPTRFRDGYDELCRIGVPTPELLAFDGSGADLPFAVAVVEDIAGGSLETRLAHDPERSPVGLDRLAAATARMHATRRRDLGTRAHPLPGVSCEQVAAQRARRHVDAAALVLPELAARRTALQDAVDRLLDAVPPRHDYRLLHGELGPDHVLLDAADRPYLIDIEGLMYFDIEWEHAFLRLRFGEHYEPLRVDGLDEDRLCLYGLCLRLSLVAGPLQLLGGDYPEQDEMAAIMRANCSAALGYL